MSAKQSIVDEIEFELAQMRDLNKKVAGIKQDFEKVQTKLAAISARKVSHSEKIKKRNSILIQNNYPKLMSEVNRLRFGSAQEKNIILTAMRRFVQAVAENEFDGYKWIAKVSGTHQQIGTRIRFDHLSFTVNDLKILFKPIVQDLSGSFQGHGISIQTKTKKENGFVVSLDITFKVLCKTVATSSEITI